MIEKPKSVSERFLSRSSDAIAWFVHANCVFNLKQMNISIWNTCIICLHFAIIFHPSIRIFQFKSTRKADRVLCIYMLKAKALIILILQERNGSMTSV